MSADRDESKDRLQREFDSHERQLTDYIRDPARTRQLVDQVRDKLEHTDPAKVDRLGPFWTYLTTLFRLLRAYVNGSYRDVPWKSLTLITFALLYFLSPLDLVPDFLIGLGFADDAAVLYWVVRQIKSDLDRFRDFEASQNLA